MSATYAQKVDALYGRKQLLSSIVGSMNYRRGFGDIRQSLELATKTSNLMVVSNKLWWARGDVNETSPGLQVKVKRGKKEKVVSASSELAAIAKEAAELAYKDGKLHKSGNFKKLLGISGRIGNLLSQLDPSAHSAAFGRLLEARERMGTDEFMFAPDNYKQIMANMKVLDSALREIERGATKFSFSLFSGFKDRSMHHQTILLIPEIIEALKAGDELTDRPPKSISDAVGVSMRLVTGLNEMLIGMGELNSRLSKLDITDKRDEKNLLQENSVVAFVSPKQSPEKAAMALVELNIALAERGLKIVESPKTEHSERGLTGGDYWWGSVDTARAIYREHAGLLVKEVKREIESRGFSVTPSDLAPPKEQADKGLFKKEPERELSTKEKMALVREVEKDYQKLRKKFQELKATATEASASNPIVKKVILLTPSAEHCPLQLVENAVFYTADQIKIRKVETKLAPPNHHPDYKEPEKISGAGMDGS